MLHKFRPLIVLLILAAVVGGGYWYLSQNPELLTQIKVTLGLMTQEEAEGKYSVSGFIETDDVSMATEIRGRIAEILVDEGDYVEAGQTVAVLDRALLNAQLKQAEAKINTAIAQLAKVKAGVRAEEIAKAEAAVAVAGANAEAAYTRWQDAIMLRDNPQELDMQIDAARTAVELAELRIAANIPVKDASETMWEVQKQHWEYVYEPKKGCFTNPKTGERMCTTFELPEGVKQDAGVAWNFAGADMWAAWVDLNTSVVQRDDAETRLNDLLRLRNDRQEAQVKVAQAEAAYQTAQAEVEVARAQLDILEAGTRAEQIAVAEAQVTQAEANLTTLQTQWEKTTLMAPSTGWVVERVAHEGEMALPDVPLMTVANLDDLTLTVYVPNPDLDLVSVGQTVGVYVDGDDERYNGTITYISDEAEFTPKNVQTKEERGNLVYAVKIKLENYGKQLKPGMPADAVLVEGKSPETGPDTNLPY
jgi:multidrug resistance efflux pump